VTAVQCGELVRPTSVFSASCVDCRTAVRSLEFEDMTNRNSEAEPGRDYSSEEQRSN
jgi:hypothetical protein